MTKRRRRRAPTLRSLARRLRTIFTARAHREAGEWASTYRKLAAEVGATIAEGGVPWEIYGGTVEVGYADSATNESGFAEVPFTAFSGSGEPNDLQRRATCEEAAWDALQEWFAAEGGARFVLSASWRGAQTAVWDHSAAAWRDDGTLLESGDTDASLALIGSKPLAGTARRAVRGQRPRRGGTWRITRRSTARGEKIRSRNRPGSKEWGGELEDFT